MSELILISTAALELYFNTDDEYIPLYTDALDHTNCNNVQCYIQYLPNQLCPLLHYSVIAASRL